MEEQVEAHFGQHPDAENQSVVSATAVATGKASSPRMAESTSDQTDVGGLKALLALLDVELDPLVLVQAAEPAR